MSSEATATRQIESLNDMFVWVAFLTEDRIQLLYEKTHGRKNTWDSLNGGSRERPHRTPVGEILYSLRYIAYVMFNNFI